MLVGLAVGMSVAVANFVGVSPSDKTRFSFGFGLNVGVSGTPQTLEAGLQLLIKINIKDKTKKRFRIFLQIYFNIGILML